MTRKALALAAMTAGLLGILFTGLQPGSGSATHLNLAHTADPQTFNVDNQACRGGASDLTGAENADVFPAGNVCVGEDLTASAAVVQYQDTIIAKGTKLSLGVNWSDSAFGVADDAAIVNGTQTGDVISAINIACDDTADFFVDNTSTLPLEGGFSDTGAVREQFNEQTTAYGPATGFGGSSEEFLNATLPPVAMYSKEVRYRADVNFVTLGTSFPVPLAVPVSLNAAVVEATFGDARASITLLGGDANAPSSQLVLCLDSAQTSIAQIDADAGLTNPAAGLWANWTSYISAAGVRDEQDEQAGYVTNCKHIGGAQTDADNDCLEAADDADEGDNDQDGDGLLDGIDASFLGGAVCPSGGASPINTADCDGDGKTDLEEMLQTSAALTNPRVADSDGDGFLDSGLNLDCNGDGAPDSAHSSTDTTGNFAGRNRVFFNVMYCKPNGTSTNVSGLGGRPVGNPPPPAVGPAEAGADCNDAVDDDADGVFNDGCGATPGAAQEDNCPSKANAPQTNSSIIDVELVAPGGDTNGRFGGTGDASHPDAKYTGDECDGDDDNDGVPDDVEGDMFFDPSGATGVGTGSNFCNLVNDDGANGEVAAPTTADNRDSDGDGSIDGVECQLARNPGDAASKPGVALNPEQQTFYRLIGLTQPAGAAVGSLDDGSTILGVSEAKGMGALAAASNDTDRDGCPDETELVDGDGNRVAADTDRLAIARAVLGVGAFAPPGSAAANVEERRNADLDFNGSLTDPDRLAAARIVLTAAIPSVPNYNLNCSAATIGYAAN
jgi:hypothetical protein